MNRHAFSVGFATFCMMSLSVSGCARPGGYLIYKPDAAGTAAGSLDAAMVAGSGVDPARIRQMEDAPPPKVEGLGKGQASPVAENPVERRAKGRAIAIGGGVVAGVGTLLIGSGALMFWGPVNCDTKKHWLCDLQQKVTGVGILSAGGLQVGIGTIILAVGAYRARQTSHEASVARAVKIAQAREGSPPP